MKKRLFSFALTLGFCVSVFAQGYAIKASVAGVADGKAILRIFYRDGNESIDTAIIQKGQFSFRGHIGDPVPADLTVNDRRNTIRLYLEPATYNVSMDINDRSKNTVTGSKLTARWNDITRQQDGESDDKHLKRLERWILDNSSDIFCSDIIASFLSYAWNYDDLRLSLNTLKRPAIEMYHYNKLREREAKLAQFAVGKRAPNFVMNNIDGVPVNFYTFLQSKKYVLLEFWASWCPDCRLENPNLVETFKRFAPSGFGIFAVSLDKDRSAWQKAIQKDQLTWTHVSDLKYWDNAVAKLYLVNAIPSNVLVDSKGIIIGRNLHGTALQEKLEEITQTKGYKIKGEIAGLPNGQVTLTKYLAGGKTETFQTQSNGGKFEFSGYTDEVCFACLNLPVDDGMFCFYLENSAIQLRGDVKNLEHLKITGSQANDGFSAFTAECNLKKNPIPCLYEKVRKNPTSIYSPAIISTYLAPYMDLVTLKRLIDTLSAPATHMYQYTVLQDFIKKETVEQKVAEKTPDFTLPNVDGGEVVLSSFISTRQYVLIDFWASWCGPCRRENPNLVAAYNRYHGRGFDILGVSLDRDRSAWLQAIKNDNLAWTQVSDLGYWNSKIVPLYKIQSIPSNVLVDKNGTVLARNLRGNALMVFLENLYTQLDAAKQ